MIVIGALAGAVTAIVAIFIPWLPDAASEEAGPIDNLYWVITIICIIIFGVVAGVSLYAVYKFRARPDDEEDGAPIHGHTGLEIFWTAIPTALVVAITVYSAVVLVDIEDIPPDSRGSGPHRPQGVSHAEHIIQIGDHCLGPVRGPVGPRPVARP